MSRRSLRFFALATAAVLAGVGVVTMSSSAQAESVPITGGTMSWGVKESFRSYVRGGISLGTVTPHDGATGTDIFTFPFKAGGSYDSAVPALDSPHVGGVKFRGHNGVLEVDIYNLRPKITPTGAFVFADATSRPFDNIAIPSPPKTYTNVPIVTLDLAGATKTVNGNNVTWTNAATTLTEEGVPVFADFYTKGTAFDPVTFTIVTGSASTTTVATSSTSTTSTTVGSTTSTTAGTGTTTTTVAPTTTTTDAPTTSTTVDSTTSTTFVFPTTTTTPGPTTTTTGVPAPSNGTAITSGFTDWGVKSTFRTYVKGQIAKGTVTYGPPATANADESVRFPLNGSTGKRDNTTNKTGAPFGGSVHYVGHDGQLDLTVSNPRVTTDGNKGTLYANVVSRTLGSSESVTYTDVPLVSLNLTGITPTSVTNGLTWTNIPTKLTEQGAPAFAGFYTAGTDFDPLNMTIGLTGEVDTTPTTNPNAPKVNLILGTPRPGSQVTVSGSGFVGGEQVQIAVLSTPRTLATVTAAADGSVAPTVVTLPSDLEVGSHQIRLLGLFSNRTVTSNAFAVTRTLARTGNELGVLAMLGAALLGLGLALRRRNS